MCGTANCSFNECGRRADGRVPDGVKFAARLGLGYGAPVLLYCLVINQALPLLIVVCQLAAGVLAGVWLYHRRRPDGFAPTAPAGRAPDEPRGTPPLMSRQPLRVNPAYGA